MKQPLLYQPLRAAVAAVSALAAVPLAYAVDRPDITVAVQQIINIGTT